MDHDYAFNLIFFPTLFAALALGAWGGWKRRWLLPLTGLLGGVLVFWGGLLWALATYFPIWQAGPNPPAEAFSDGAPLVFVLFAGWLPGLVLTGSAFAVARLIRARRHAARKA